MRMNEAPAWEPPPVAQLFWGKVRNVRSLVHYGLGLGSSLVRIARITKDNARLLKSIQKASLKRAKRHGFGLSFSL